MRAILSQWTPSSGREQPSTVYWNQVDHHPEFRAVRPRIRSSTDKDGFSAQKSREFAMSLSDDTLILFCEFVSRTRVPVDSSGSRGFGVSHHPKREATGIR
jgi:hypothetical protein